MGVDSLPKTVTRQHRGCDLNQGPTAPESNTLTTRPPSHLSLSIHGCISGTTCLVFTKLYIEAPHPEVWFKTSANFGD